MLLCGACRDYIHIAFICCYVGSSVNTCTLCWECAHSVGSVVSHAHAFICCSVESSVNIYTLCWECRVTCTLLLTAALLGLGMSSSLAIIVFCSAFLPVFVMLSAMPKVKKGRKGAAAPPPAVRRSARSIRGCNLWSLNIVNGRFGANKLIGDYKCYNKNGVSCLSKLFTSVLNHRITEYLEGANAIGVELAGFRSGY